jgi:hypothetical protein
VLRLDVSRDLKNMKKMVRTVVFLMTLIAAGDWAAQATDANTPPATIKWENTQLEFNPTPTDTDVKADYVFTVSGSEPVTIEDVIPSCGCTTTSLDKKTYQPGEKGHIPAKFNIGARTGVQHKTIRVKFKNETAPTNLTLIVHIPELIKISPQFVYWMVGDVAQAKKIDLTVSPDAKVSVTKVFSSDPKIMTGLETVQAGKAYKVVVTPTQTATPLMAVLTIEVSMPPNQQKLMTAYAQIKPLQAPVKPAETK